MRNASSRSSGSRTRRALLAVSAILLSCLPGVLAGEILLRSLANDSWFVWPPNLRQEFHPSPELMPGVEGIARFEINSQGLRGDDFAKDQDIRFLALGGSTTECLYLDGPEAWPRLLQDHLRAGGKRVWVGNAGRSGHNTWHHRVQAEKLLAQYPRIDVVLVLAGVNDLSLRLGLDRSYAPPSEEKVTDEAFKQKPLQLGPGPLYKRTALWQGVAKIGWRLRNKQETVQDSPGSIYARWRRHRQGASGLRTELPDLGTALEDYADNLRAIADTTARHGARVVFMTQPFMWREDLPEDLEALLWMGGVGRFLEESGHEYYTVEALAEGMAAYNRTLLEVCREIPGALCIDLAARLPQDAEALLWMGGVGPFQQESGHEYYTVEALAEGMAAYNRTLLEVCRETPGAVCVDLAASLPQDATVFYDDVHFNEAGSQKVARVVAEGVAGADLLR